MSRVDEPGAAAMEPEPEPVPAEDGEDDAAEFDAPRTVLVTGAAGIIGRKLCAAWADSYDLIRVDQTVDPTDVDLIVADLSVWDESWTGLFDEADTVVHLAANPDPGASWPDLVGPNLDATAHVLLAAAQAGVDRVILASSCHVMGGYLDPETSSGGPIITADMPPRPVNAYGASKLMVERLGRSFAAAFGLTVVALRIGWIQAGENRYDALPEGPFRSVWLSDGDLARLMSRAVEAELEEGEFVVAFGRSDTPGARWSLVEAAERLGYTPLDRP